MSDELQERPRWRVSTGLGRPGTREPTKRLGSHRARPTFLTALASCVEVEAAEYLGQRLLWRDLRLRRSGKPRLALRFFLTLSPGLHPAGSSSPAAALGGILSRWMLAQVVKAGEKERHGWRCCGRTEVSRSSEEVREIDLSSRRGDARPVVGGGGRQSGLARVVVVVSSPGLVASRRRRAVVRPCEQQLAVELG